MEFVSKKVLKEHVVFFLKVYVRERKNILLFPKSELIEFLKIEKIIFLKEDLEEILKEIKAEEFQLCFPELDYKDFTLVIIRYSKLKKLEQDCK